ncbi:MULTISPECIES: hypothetical protein [unclassified Beijerinckia]|uniref:hypothetical protein n=1 Tax=unclassified Beijerinckia TaxID=2638183 RepID=UPI00147B3992|nr:MULTISPECIES: hypothetical protein [unclassified Beijerinckia]
MAIGIATNSRRGHAFARKNDGHCEKQAKGKESAHVGPPAWSMSYDGSAIMNGTQL